MLDWVEATLEVYNLWRFRPELKCDARGPRCTLVLVESHFFVCRSPLIQALLLVSMYLVKTYEFL